MGVSAFTCPFFPPRPEVDFKVWVSTWGLLGEGFCPGTLFSLFPQAIKNPDLLPHQM